MAGIATAAIAGSVITGVIGARSQAKAAESASDAQSRAALAGIAEQRRQFAAIQKLLAPYSKAGLTSLDQQQDLLGLHGGAQQKAVINSIAASPEMLALTKQGENAILQNASATGGLRGGNVQAALAQFRPELLSQLISQRFQNLGGITSLGQNAAAGTGNAGMNNANQIAGLLQQQGAAQAGNALAQGNYQSQLWGGVGQTIGNIAALKALKVF